MWLVLFFLSLTQNSQHGFALNQFARLIEVVVHNGAGIDADAVVDAGEKLSRVHRLLDRSRRGLVGLAIYESAFDARASRDGGIAIGPVIAPIVVVVVAARTHATLRTSAELAHH